MENIKRGLTSEEVKERISKGQVNVSSQKQNKTNLEIIRDNTFTLFNSINILLAVLIITTGQYENLLFMGIIFTNIVIGSFQEIRARNTLSKIKLIVSSKATVIRDNKLVEIPITDIVLGDYVRLRTGNQIVADAVMCEGFLEVDESLLTGESETVKKFKGDYLYSGSYVVSGEAMSEVDKVGDDNYAAQITINAKQFRVYPSELRNTLNKIVKYIGITLIPFGLAMAFKDFFILHNDWNSTILSVSAALIGMIPEGLVILTSISLAVGTINLARHRTLVQELYCIETLARVDVLCLDKTGTITEGKMDVEEYIPLKDCDEKKIIGNLLGNLSDDNPTINAIRNKYHAIDELHAVNIVSFSSKRKYSGVSFKEGKYLMGAYEFICDQRNAKEEQMIEKYSAMGKRVLCLAKADELDEQGVKGVEILGFLVLVDRIRESAYETLKYFHDQDVDIKIISGDNPLTVSEVAKRAGVDTQDKFVDASTLTDEDIPEAVSEYKVFGRVSPDQKCLMVKALRAQGHSVGMTGDGVNDVLAFKEANVSIAMASGSDVARNSANLVLLDSNFDAMPYVLNEGRRVINNIQRAATLFLTKTIYSCILTLMVLLLPVEYPFRPVQLTMVSVFTIGLPSLVIALEPNHNRIKGKFFGNLLKVCFPAAVAVILSMAYVYQMTAALGESKLFLSTYCVVALCVDGLVVLFYVSYPFSTLRKFVYAISLSGIVISLYFFASFLNIDSVHWIANFPHIMAITAIIVLVFIILNKVLDAVEEKK